MPLATAAAQRTWRALIIGSGDIGTRHLQALAGATNAAIEVVDPRPEALQLGRSRWADVARPGQAPRVAWLSALEQATPGGDLCIVATQAAQRPELVRAAVERLGYRAFLLEKIVAPSVDAYQALLRYAEEHQVSAWVNCQTRCHPFFQAVKQRLDPAEPLVCTVLGGNQGLATNGVHAADLFAYLDGAERIMPAGARIDPILHPSKRGAELFDVSGTLEGVTQKGSRLTISFAPQLPQPAVFSIATSSYRCVMDPVAQWAAESHAGDGWAWKTITPIEDLRVSRLTADFAADIVAIGQCRLPTLRQAFIAHEYVLGQLQPHFSRLLGRPITACPVT